MSDIPVTGHISSVWAPYQVLFVDIWGVVHNGVAPFEASVAALRQARAEGKCVVLISNAPRLSKDIPPQFARIGVPQDIYDSIVTSGDATKDVMRSWCEGASTPMYHIGPTRDLSLFESLPIARVGLEEAKYVVCSGLNNDETESADDYEDVLRAIVERGLPFLCANPDIVVRRGDKLVFCAGALAERLETLGGAVIYPGKPHAPIYDLALARAEEICGRAIAHEEILAIGDGVKTDLLGAQRFGAASVFVVGGIHADQLGRGADIDAAGARKACTEAGVQPVAIMPELAF